MGNFANNGNWADSYVRDQLNPGKMAEFEAALLDSPELQQQLETSLGMRRAMSLELDLEGKAGGHAAVTAPLKPRVRNYLPGMAVAASLLLAMFTTVMYWRADNENSTLLTHMADLSQPSGTVLSVPVDIMRSLGDGVPDVIIKKPEGQAVLVLDIELGRALVGAGPVNLVLRNLQDEELFSWESANTTGGRLSTAFQASSLPEGKVWLELSDAAGKNVDSRLLEFR